MGRTDSSGELSFRWNEPQPLRIIVRGNIGRVLNSTDTFLTLMPEAETVVDLPVTPGRLQVFLPSGTEAVEHEAVQYSLWRSNETETQAWTETVYGGAALSETDRVKRAPGHVEFKSVRPGNYTVTARFMVHQQDGRWLPSGNHLRGSAVVKPGSSSECYVH